MRTLRPRALYAAWNGSWLHRLGGCVWDDLRTLPNGAVVQRASCCGAVRVQSPAVVGEVAA